MAPVDPGPEKKLEELFTKLDDQIKDQQYKTSLKTIGDILEISPGDPDAVKCKVVALMHDDKFGDALKEIDKAESSLAAQLSFEKAYCLYRQGKLEETLEVLQSCPEDKLAGRLQLEAQVLNKLERSSECVARFEALQEAGLAGGEEVDLAVNYSAALVAAGRAADVAPLLPALKVAHDDSFELCYNSGCALLEERDLDAAQQRLEMALRLGKEELFEDDMTEEEVQDELAALRVQLAYCQSLQGADAAALEALQEVLKAKPSDPAVAAVATNNLVAARGPKDLFDANKRFDRLMVAPAAANTTLADALEVKLSTGQKRAVLFNRCLIMLHASKLNACRELLAKLATLYPGSDTVPLIEGALLLREKKGTRADEVLERFVGEKGKGGPPVQLMRAQMAAAQGNWRRAIAALEAVPKLALTPAVVTTLVALHEAAGDVPAAQKLLEEAVAHFEAAASQGEEYAGSQVAEAHGLAAAFHARHGLHAGAASLYRRMQGRGDQEALPGLVHATSYFSPDQAAQDAAALPPMEEVDEDELMALEAGTGLNVTSGIRKRGRRDDDDDDDDDDGAQAQERLPKEKKKKKRKPRLPKGFDPANPGPPPDPERWLPRQERSKFMKKTRKKDEVNVKGGQGVSAAEAAKLEAKLEAKIPVEKAPEPEPAISKPAGNRNSGKKGKKGRR